MKLTKAAKIAIGVAGGLAVGTGGFFGIKALKKKKRKKAENSQKNEKVLCKNCEKSALNEVVVKEEPFEPTPDELKEFQEVLEGLGYSSKEEAHDELYKATKAAADLRLVKDEILAAKSDISEGSDGDFDVSCDDEVLQSDSELLKEVMDDISVGNIHTISLGEYNDANGFEKEDYQLYNDGAVVVNDMTGELLVDVHDILGADFPYECGEDAPVIYVRNPYLQTDYRIEYQSFRYGDMFEEDTDD